MNQSKQVPEIQREDTNGTHDLASIVGTITKVVGDLYRVKHEITTDPTNSLYPKKGIARVILV